MIGRLEPHNLEGLVMSEIHRRRPRRYKFEFSFAGNDRLPSQKSGTRRENRLMLPILQICPRPSQKIVDIYDFKFSLVSKIWDSRETVKSPIAWDFPDIWKTGLNTSKRFPSHYCWNTSENTKYLKSTWVHVRFLPSPSPNVRFTSKVIFIYLCTVFQIHQAWNIIKKFKNLDYIYCVPYSIKSIYERKKACFPWMPCLTWYYNNCAKVT